MCHAATETHKGATARGERWCAALESYEHWLMIIMKRLKPLNAFSSCCIRIEPKLSSQK
jgi:hypothetical protein